MFSGMGQVPWHKMGEVVAGRLTAAEAIKAARMDWVVALEEIYSNHNGISVPIEGHKGVVRQDTGACIGVVGSRYTPIQNHECFDFMDSLVAEGKMKYETAGTLRGGSVIWMMAKYDGELQINGDRHEQWCLLSSSHNGSRNLMLQWTAVRVVCWNTLSMAWREATNRVCISHRRNWQGKIDEARRVLGLTEDYFKALKANLDGLNEQLLTPEQMDQFSRLLLPPGEEESTRNANIRAEINALFGRGAGNQGRSRWDALNAVTDYADHHSTLRGPNSTRLESAMMGSAAALKERAAALLTSEDLMAQLMALPVQAAPVEPMTVTPDGSNPFIALLNKN